MLKKNSKLHRNHQQKCVSTRNFEPLEDRAAVSRSAFPPLNLEVQYPDTAILLLKTPEKPILLAAAAALAQYGEKAKSNLDVLFDLKATDSVLGLIQHEDVFTQRFALKLLAMMSAVPNVQTHLLEVNDTYIEFFINMLISEFDVFLQEFSSRILAELSSNPSGVVKFYDKTRDFGFLFEKMKVDDPDVKKNCMEITINLLKDLRGFDYITKSKEFSFDVIYAFFKQPYPIMQQLALDAVERLVMHNADNWLQEAFQLSGGLRCLLDILDEDEWNDLHSRVLRVLRLACDNNKTADLMNNTNGTTILIGFMEKTSEDELKYETLKILVRLAESVNGKKVLYSRGFVEHLLSYLEMDVRPDVHANVCLGIVKMTRHIRANEVIAQAKPTSYILSLLNNTEANWPERQTAAFSLKELFSSDYQNCINFIDSNGQNYLMRLINQPVTEVPWETQVTVTQAISAIADYSTITPDLVDMDLFFALCSSLEPDSPAPADLKIASIDVICRFATISAARRLLIHVGLLQTLCQLVTSSDQPVPVREAGIRLILILCVDQVFAQLFVEHGLLLNLLKNCTAASHKIPTWGACIELLFNADLPMKFAYTGRLALHDISQDGFYAMRRNSCPFPVLEELFHLKLCPMEPIYVANFADVPDSGVDDDRDEHFANKRAAFDVTRAVLRRESQIRGIRVSDGTINAWLELKFGRLQPDPQLQTYLKTFKAELAAFEGRGDGDLTVSSPELVHISRIGSRARVLGNFVCRQLSGISPYDNLCIEQQLELHLRAIKQDIETSIIPLGQLRVGSYFERALLFKVIADRIGLPASLVRGKYRKSWIEIAVPMISEAKSDETLPIKYLCENYIVDLMEQPGELVPIGSIEAKRYREQGTACEFACCR